MLKIQFGQSIHQIIPKYFEQLLSKISPTPKKTPVVDAAWPKKDSKIYAFLVGAYVSGCYY